MSNIADSNNEPPPVPPTVIPSVVDTLDPDLAAAYRAGNPTIIQAVNAGMTTNAMIVNEVIRMGGGMSGLPPAIQSMVTERQKEMAEQAEAENARLKALAAGVVGMALMGSNIAKGGEYYGDAPTNKTANNPYTNSGTLSQEQISQIQQDMAYVSSISRNQYDAMSPEEQQVIHNTTINSGTALTENAVAVLSSITSDLERRVNEGSLSDQARIGMIQTISFMAAGLEHEEVKDSQGKPILGQDGKPITRISGFDSQKMDEHLDKEVAAGRMSQLERQEAERLAAQYKHVVESSQATGMAKEAERLRAEGNQAAYDALMSASSRLKVEAQNAELLSRYDPTAECGNVSKMGLANTKAALAEQAKIEAALGLDRFVPHTREENTIRIEKATATSKLEIIEEEMMRDKLTPQERMEIREAAQNGKMDNLPQDRKELAEYYAEGLKEGGDPQKALNNVANLLRYNAMEGIIESAAADQASQNAELVKMGTTPVTATETKKIDAVVTENYDAREKLDAAAVKVQAQTATVADGYDDEPKVASAAPRLSINAQPLASAGMLQPEGVVAANDPKPTPPEAEIRRVATPTQGMNA